MNPGTAPPKRPLNARHVRPVDGFGPRPVRMQPVRTQSLPERPKPAPAKPAVIQGPQSQLADRVQLILFIIAGLGMGLLFQFMPLGQVAVMLYGIVAVARGIASTYTFLAALGCVVLASVMTMAGWINIITESFAIYTFLLLIVGVVSAALEQRRAARLAIKQKGGSPQ